MAPSCGECGSTELAYSEGRDVCTKCGLVGMMILETVPEMGEYHTNSAIRQPTYIPDVHLERHLFKLEPPLAHNLVMSIRLSFPKVYDTFFQICEPGRKNFLSYQFVIAELLKISGVEDPYNEYGIQRLKTPARYKQHVTYWDKMLPRLSL